MNSKKLWKLIEVLYKNNTKNFIEALKQQNLENQKIILIILDNRNENNSKEIKPALQQNDPDNNNNNGSCGKIKRIINTNKLNNNNINSLEEIKNI